MGKVRGSLFDGEQNASNSPFFSRLRLENSTFLTSSLQPGLSHRLEMLYSSVSNRARAGMEDHKCLIMQGRMPSHVHTRKRSPKENNCRFQWRNVMDAEILPLQNTSFNAGSIFEFSLPLQTRIGLDLVVFCAFFSVQRSCKG